MNRSILILGLSTALSLTACVQQPPDEPKVVPVPGPAVAVPTPVPVPGPPGPQGPQGPQGATGEQGDKGNTGDTNVIVEPAPPQT